AGRRVDHRLLTDVSELPADELIGLLREAVDHHVLVVESDPIAMDTYAFRHALMQEAIYDDLLAAERTRLHCAYARALSRRIEARTAGTEARTAGTEAATAVELARLAFHWDGGDEPDRALPAHIRAGTAAEASGAPAEAQEHYERAIELWDRVRPETVAQTPL